MMVYDGYMIHLTLIIVVITAVLMVTSGPENSQNNWLLDDEHLSCSMMKYGKPDLDICSYGN